MPFPGDPSSSMPPMGGAGMSGGSLPDSMQAGGMNINVSQPQSFYQQWSPGRGPLSTRQMMSRFRGARQPIMAPRYTAKMPTGLADASGIQAAQAKMGALAPMVQSRLPAAQNTALALGVPTTPAGVPPAPAAPPAPPAGGMPPVDPAMAGGGMPPMPPGGGMGAAPPPPANPMAPSTPPPMPGDAPPPLGPDANLVDSLAENRELTDEIDPNFAGEEMTTAQPLPTDKIAYFSGLMSFLPGSPTRATVRPELAREQALARAVGSPRDTAIEGADLGGTSAGAALGGIYGGAQGGRLANRLLAGRGWVPVEARPKGLLTAPFTRGRLLAMLAGILGGGSLGSFAGGYVGGRIGRSTAADSVGPMAPSMPFKTGADLNAPLVHRGPDGKERVTDPLIERLEKAKRRPVRGLGTKFAESYVERCYARQTDPVSTLPVLLQTFGKTAHDEVVELLKQANPALISGLTRLAGRGAQAVRGLFGGGTAQRLNAAQQASVNARFGARPPVPPRYAPSGSPATPLPGPQSSSALTLPGAAGGGMPPPPFRPTAALPGSAAGGPLTVPGSGAGAAGKWHMGDRLLGGFLGGSTGEDVYGTTIDPVTGERIGNPWAQAAGALGGFMTGASGTRAGRRGLGLARGMHNAMMGSTVGSTLDMAAGTLGIDTGDRLGQIGARGGLALGAAKHLTRGMPGVAPAVRQFGTKPLQTGFNAATLPFTWAFNKISPKAEALYQRAFPQGLMSRGGLRRLATGGLAAAGAAPFVSGAVGMIPNAVDNYVNEKINTGLQAGADATDQYLAQRGLLGTDGQINMTPNILQGLRQYLTPENLHRAALYGGGALGAYGLASGSPWLAAGGLGSALYGGTGGQPIEALLRLLAGASQAEKGQPSRHVMPRNELQYQGG